MKKQMENFTSQFSEETRKNMSKAQIERWKNTKEENRQQILSTAEDVFTSIGYQNTTIKKIQKYSNISRGTIYKYFKNKDDIYIALCAKSLEKFIELTEDHLKQHIFKLKGLFLAAKTLIFEYPFYAEILNDKFLRVILASFYQKRVEGKEVSEAEVEYYEIKEKGIEVLHQIIKGNLNPNNKQIDWEAINSLVAALSAMLGGAIAEFVYRIKILNQPKEKVNKDIDNAFQIIELGLKNLFSKHSKEF